jgi:xylulose-5-phosphate/fructose-6-phosphate phosphoketolase
MTVQHSKWLQESIELPWRKPVPPLDVLLTSTCWRNDHNGFSHQGPGLIDVMLSKRGAPSPASTSRQSGGGDDPDIMLATAGDVPTMEILAAAEWLRRHAPEISFRVVNVVDLMTLFPREQHPHGMDESRFVNLFTADRPVIFAFHGYRRAIHEIIHGHFNTHRFHVRGFMEQGTTTTPFNMVVLNGMSRYHLCIEALRRVERFQPRAASLIQELETRIADSIAYARQHFEDPADIRNWAWSGDPNPRESTAVR